MFVRVTLLISGLFWAASLFGAEPGEESAELSKAYGIQIPEQAPGRRTGEGNGPFPRLVIDGAMLVDGLGSPPRGPVSIVIEEDIITSIQSSAPKSVPGEERIDATGMTALLNKPESFDKYIIGRPFTNPPDRQVFRMEEAYPKSHAEI